VPSLDSVEIEERLDFALPDLNWLSFRESVGQPTLVPTFHQLATERDRTLRVQCIESPRDIGEPSVGDAFFSRISQ
jgi:hypothetical protein